MNRFAALLSGVLALSFGAAHGGGRANAGLEHAIADAQERVFPAVVFVKPIQESYAAGERSKLLAYGSGVVISPDGLVVTNNHVVDKAVEIRCVLSDKRETLAELLGRDRETDLALLRLKLEEGERAPFVPFGDSDRLKAGEFVMAMGAPFGFVRSVSLGIVSNTRRFLSASPYNLWIQTDAAINPGNSGGPLVNLRGEVVGINARGVFLADNIGFAIPSNRVKEVIAAIREHGAVPRGWLGVHLQPLRDFEKSIFIPAEEGVMVASVDRNSPAQEGGLRTGDRIVSVNGVRMRGLYMEDLPALHRSLAALPPDEPAAVEAVRDGKTEKIAVTPVPKGKVEGDDLELKEWDLTVKEINKYTDRLLAYFRPVGVFVQGVKAGGNAAASGLSAGDVIVKIGGEEVTDLVQVQGIYEGLDGLPRGQRKVLWEVIRGGYATAVVLDFNRESQERRRRRQGAAGRAAP